MSVCMSLALCQTFTHSLLPLPTRSHDSSMILGQHICRSFISILLSVYKTPQISLHLCMSSLINYFLSAEHSVSFKVSKRTMWDARAEGRIRSKYSHQ